jgi:hypothetical protein
MKNLFLPTLLHHANRFAADIYAGKYDFYKIKTSILKAHAIHIGFDIQHIPGKKCWTCAGTGEYRKYSSYPPFKLYDIDSCWHCAGTGWYKLHKFVILEVFKFGRFTFHNPFVSKETRGTCPFPTPEGTKIITGYVEHRSTKYGVWCIAILFALYGNKEMAAKYFKRAWDDLVYPITKIKYKIRRLRSNTWREILLYIPMWPNLHFIKADGSLEEINEELPF